MDRSVPLSMNNVNRTVLSLCTGRYGQGFDIFEHSEKHQPKLLHGAFIEMSLKRYEKKSRYRSGTMKRIR